MIAIVLGTRPEIIKMCPVVRECQKRGVEHFVLHTGQHYSYDMDKVFFDELELPEPRHKLEVGSGLHGEQTGKMLAGIEKVLLEERPDVVLVQGDTNTVLAGALAASKLGVKVGHVEAGLRCYDRTMPEEINRVLADHVSDLLFVPTEMARQHLAREGIAKGVYRTGNTVVDAVRQNLDLAERKSNVLHRLGLEDEHYLVATAHRQENVDDRGRLEGMIKGMQRLSEELRMSLVFPAHPRTRKRMEEFGMGAEGILVTEPLGYLDFLMLEANARLILTDSGGVQEEACILHVPCVTMRRSTERPETLAVKANLLAGTDPKAILEMARRQMRARRRWRNPFGDGRAAERIVARCIRVRRRSPESSS
ncbi:MAG TPA: UDP-N-acetylglucosamine 2-epimerase (non-hydrolyzing) [Methanomassiliicoccales archaeon]|nr:UDP-N-acetylglucosamine 2-epimerase (non-hydrolyzing) [Methanomassiliicoccales archaeon]